MNPGRSSTRGCFNAEREACSPKSKELVGAQMKRWIVVAFFNGVDFVRELAGEMMFILHTARSFNFGQRACAQD